MLGQSGPQLHIENKCDWYFSLVKSANCSLDTCFDDSVCKLIFL